MTVSWKVSAIAAAIAVAGAGAAVGPPVRVAAQVSEQPLGAAFTLRHGSKVRLTGTTATVEFVKVSDDSRCPKEARCVRAGDATVHLSLVQGTAKPVEIILHTERPRPMTQAGLRITLTDLQPPTSIAQPLVQKDYVVSLQVDRATEPAR